MISAEMRAATTFTLSGQRMIERFIVAEQRPWTPNLTEFTLAVAQLFYGIAFSPIGLYDLRPGGTLYTAVHNDLALQWLYGVWGMIATLSVIGHILAWTGLVYPIYHARIALLILSSGFWMALVAMLIMGGNYAASPLYIVASVLTVSNVRAAVRNGRVSARALQQLER